MTPPFLRIQRAGHVETHKSRPVFGFPVMNMAAVKANRRSRRSDEGKLTDGARRELEEAREQMARGEYVTHEEVMARYG